LSVERIRGRGLSLASPMETQALSIQPRGSLPEAASSCKCERTVRIQAYADAAVNGERTGLGYWARRQGEVLLMQTVQISEALHPVMAEILGCYLLLLELDRLGFRGEPITLYLDHAEVVDWLRWRARPRRQELRMAVSQTRKLARKFKQLRIYYLGREKNLRAHRLARRAMRGEGSPWRP